MKPRRVRARRAPEPAVRITSATVSLTEDVAARTRRYMLQMGIRVVCFLGAVTVQHWSRWLLLAGAVVLPYLAVIGANAGRERGTDPGTYHRDEPFALPAGGAPPHAAPRTEAPPDAAPPHPAPRDDAPPGRAPRGAG